MQLKDSKIKLSEYCFAKVSNYKANTNANRVPLWDAPETFMNGDFTQKSDVWSFGVTVWEIFSNGTRPYIGVGNIKKFLKSQRLPKPENCPDDVYLLLTNGCWKEDPEERYFKISFY